MYTFKPHAAVSFSIALMLLLAFSDSLIAQRKKRQSRRPSISLAKVHKDVIGKVVERFPSAETGSDLANWTFAEKEPREIEILERKFAGDDAYVTIKMYTQEVAPNNGLLTSL